MEAQRAEKESFRAGKKKKKKLRRRKAGEGDDEDEDDLGKQGKGKKLDLDKLEAEARAAGISDLGSKQAGQSLAAARRAEEKQREETGVKAAYDAAYAKAVEASNALREEHGAGKGEGVRGEGRSDGPDLTPLPNDDKPRGEEERVKSGGTWEEASASVKEEEEVVVGEDDEELQRSLQRARQVRCRK